MCTDESPFWCTGVLSAEIEISATVFMFSVTLVFEIFLTIFSKKCINQDILWLHDEGKRYWKQWNQDLKVRVACVLSILLCKRGVPWNQVGIFGWLKYCWGFLCSWVCFLVQLSKLFDLYSLQLPGKWYGAGIFHTYRPLEIAPDWGFTQSVRSEDK